MTAGPVKFVRWTVIRTAARDDRGRQRSVVRCRCGTEAIVLDDALRRGNTTGCRSVTCRKQFEEAQAAQAEAAKRGGS